MKTRDPSPLRALVAAALLAAPGVQAQSADEMVERAMQVAQAGFDFGPGDAADALLGGRANERVVKGAPFCAEAQHEQVQWLPDGSGGAPNRIVRQTAWKICRDGEGRTRQEVERNGSTRVYLRDPVARENWVIDPARKTAAMVAPVSVQPPPPPRPAFVAPPIPEPLSTPSAGGSSFHNARTANEMLKAQERKLRLDERRGQLVEKARALMLVHRLAKEERDAILAWPARIAAELAAELGVDAHRLQTLMDAKLRQHLAERNDVRVAVA